MGAVMCCRTLRSLSSYSCIIGEAARSADGPSFSRCSRSPKSSTAAIPCSRAAAISAPALRSSSWRKS
eukprot:1505018-Prymnesium_polylepis.1